MLWAMAEGATWILLLLCIFAQTSATAGCDNDIPRRCAFNGTGIPALCGWSLGGNFVHNTSDGGFIQLVRGSDTGNLTSRTICSTRGQPYCFRFAYRFDEHNTINLSVSIRHEVSDKPEDLMWIMSSSGQGWPGASFLMKANYSFNVIFRATRLSGQAASKGEVGIDEIRYGKSNSCTLQPPNASPTWVPSTPSPRNNTVSSPATTANGTTSQDTMNGITGMSPFFTSSSNSGNPLVQTNPNDNTLTTHSTSMLPSLPGSNENKPTDSSIDLGLIVGVVVGVIFVIIVVVLLLVLCRRKRRNKQKANNTHQTSNLHRPDPATSTQPSGNPSIMVGVQDPTSAAESAMPEYAVVNKQRKVKQENAQQSSHKMGDQTAQQHSQSSERNDVTEQEMKDKGGYDNYSLARIREPPTASSSMYQVPRGDTATFSQGQGEEYNVLDFKGDNVAMEDRCVHGESDGAASAVYNHLNEGYDDTYNKVDSQKRPEVLSDEYSHIQ